jgi:hypothetical protein
MELLKQQNFTIIQNKMQFKLLFFLQRTAEEEFAVSEAPQFGHPLKDIVLDEGQPAHFETTLTPVNDATMKV